MQSRTDLLSSVLAGDGTVSDYDLWRAQRQVEIELFNCREQSRPIPIDLLYARRIIDGARAKRVEVDE